MQGKWAPTEQEESLKKNGRGTGTLTYVFALLLPHRCQHLPNSKNSALVNEGSGAMSILGANQDRITKGSCSTRKVW